MSVFSMSTDFILMSILDHHGKKQILENIHYDTYKWQLMWLTAKRITIHMATNMNYHKHQT